MHYSNKDRKEKNNSGSYSFSDGKEKERNLIYNRLNLLPIFIQFFLKTKLFFQVDDKKNVKKVVIFYSCNFRTE